MSEKSREIVCGCCGKPLFYGEVLAEFWVTCGPACGWRMLVEPLKPMSELADAIVESLASAPIIISNDGGTPCNCSECRLRRSGSGLIEGWQG